MTKYSETPAALRLTSAYRIAKDALGYMRDHVVLKYLDTKDPFYRPLAPAQTQAVRDELRDRGIEAPAN